MSVQMLSPSEVATHVGSGATLIDVRTPIEFAAVHARGAHNVPLDRLDPSRLGPSQGGQRICLICKSGSRAAKACDTLRAAGWKDVSIVEGGTDAWVRDGLPVERREVITLERQVRIGAGLLVLLGVVLGIWVHPWLLGIAAFVGVGLVFAGVTNFCGMALLLARAPWNRMGHVSSCEL